MFFGRGAETIRWQVLFHLADGVAREAYTLLARLPFPLCIAGLAFCECWTCGKRRVWGNFLDSSAFQSL